MFSLETKRNLPWYILIPFCILRILWVTFNNLQCIPTYILWCFFGIPLRWANPDLFWELEGWLFKGVLYMLSGWAWTAGYTISEVGDDISKLDTDEAIMLINHQSTGDVPTAMTMLLNKGRAVCGSIWIIDHLFKYSNFGLVSQIRGDFFIKQGKDTREREIKALGEHLLNIFWTRHRKWLIIFPEGGFLRKRKANSQSFGRKHNLPLLHHVTLPRVGAVEMAMNTLSSSAISNGTSSHTDTDTSRLKMGRLKWVIDVTVGYPGGKALDFQSITSGFRQPCETVIHFQKFPIDEVPKDTNNLKQWLYDRYIEKDAMLDQFYKTGKFPVKQQQRSLGDDGKVLYTPKPIQLSCITLAVLHLLFLASSVFHYKVVCYLGSFIF
ncbi:unnamed protein product [Owenia fusiformis]|uniref:Uncharacterized protein n=1 Tax=Owenia fusiformis TaxID=6347 RepID=A0A8J1XV90_OWEFU|nr:unnamed protein product [Owenia fusiformis]